MSMQRPDPTTVAPEHVATAARQRISDLTDQLLMRDAKIGELIGYANSLEERIAMLEQESAEHLRRAGRASRAPEFGPEAAAQREVS